MYMKKRSTNKVYKIDSGSSVRAGRTVSVRFQKFRCLVGRLGSELRVVGRLWSGIWVNASLQIVALRSDGNILGGEGNCPGGRMSEGNMSEGEMSRRENVPYSCIRTSKMVWYSRV